MLAKCEIIGDAVKSLIAGLWITFSVCSVGVHGQEGKIKTYFVDAIDKIKKNCDVRLVRNLVCILLSLLSDKEMINLWCVLLWLKHGQICNNKQQ